VHCIIRWSIQEEEQAKICVENTHVLIFELIEEDWFKFMVFYLILCVLMLICSRMFVSCCAFNFICCVYDFMVELKFEGKEE
jgi:hypothetical protein